LALRRFKLKDLLIGAAALAALLSASALIATLLHEQYNADLILIYGSAKHLVVLWVAIVAAAPLSEELLFRGFMFTGLAESRLGWSGAIALSSIAWTALHIQYDMFQIGEMFVLGIVLGWLRRRSGSIWVPFIIHGLNNLIASYYYTAYSRG
jgi:membrane protease YdiL (CAAX protease family)